MRILNLNARYFVDPFKRLGHDVLCLGPNQGCDVVIDRHLSLRGLLSILEARSFRPDLILWCDSCQIPSVIGFEAMPALTIGFSIDQYCNPWHVPYSAAFDLMLVAQKDFLPMFQMGHLQRPVEWLPLFCDPKKALSSPHKRDIPVSFVGTVEKTINKERAGFLAEFKRLAPLAAVRGDYAPVYGRSRIVLNQSAAGELNFRLFEAMGCGAAVLTEDTENGLCDLFTPGRDLLLYPRGDGREAARIALAALNNPKLEEIALAGRRKVLAKHSASVRARHILKLAREMILEKRMARRLSNLPLIKGEMAKAWTSIGLDQDIPLPRNQREFYANLAYRAM